MVNRCECDRRSSQSSRESAVGTGRVLVISAAEGVPWDQFPSRLLPSRTGGTNGGERGFLISDFPEAKDPLKLLRLTSSATLTLFLSQPSSFASAAAEVPTPSHPLIIPSLIATISQSKPSLPQFSPLSFQVLGLQLQQIKRKGFGNK